jgi:uncharacterized protein
VESTSRFYVFRLKPHQDLKQSILQWAKQNSIKAGVVVTGVGSLEQYHLRFANQEQGSKVVGYFEIISLVGTLSHSSCHLHMSVSDNKGRTTAGHLLDDCLIYTTAEIVVAELTDVEFTRELDSTYGYRELNVKKILKL